MLNYYVYQHHSDFFSLEIWTRACVRPPNQSRAKHRSSDAAIEADTRAEQTGMHGMLCVCKGRWTFSLARLTVRRWHADSVSRDDMKQSADLFCFRSHRKRNNKCIQCERVFGLKSPWIHTYTQMTIECIEWNVLITTLLSINFFRGGYFSVEIFRERAKEKSIKNVWCWSN